MFLNESYWTRYWKSLTLEQRLQLADLLLDRDSGEVGWIKKDNFIEFPKYIQEMLIPQNELNELKQLKQRVEKRLEWLEKSENRLMRDGLDIKRDEIEHIIKSELQQLLTDDKK